MSLQGTLDTFGLQDVLSLLSSTKKKGELQVRGPGFAGSVWMDEGKLVGAEVPRCPTLVDAVFELLRLPQGDFSFQGDSPVRGPMTAQSVGDVLSDAEDRLIEWRDIAIHIPSVHVKLQLVPASPSSQVVLDPDQWRLVVAAGHGVTLAELAEFMDMGEFQICRTAKFLVENGLATAEPVAPPAVPAPPAPAPVQDAPVQEAPKTQPEPSPAQAEQPAAPTPAPEPEPQAPAPQPTTPPRPAAPAPQPAAAAQAPPPPPAVEEDPANPGEPVDRSALLKFLSSVRN
ncbi:MAG TPA: DUF4388 domain-containing protein [Acidimicrobiales bacterium]|nr:DUF4388 domain-containing protein [Acidimicrobiales bacterium]